MQAALSRLMTETVVEARCSAGFSHEQAAPDSHLTVDMLCEPAKNRGADSYQK